MRLPKRFSSSLVVLILGAVVLSSCGTTASLSSSTTTTKTTVSQSTTSTTATTSTTTSAPPSTTTTTIQQSNVVTRCHASQLSYSYSQLGLFASQQLNVIFRYTNTSNVTCTLYGYPGIEFYTANGQPITAKILRRGAYPIGSAPGPNLVTLTPGTNAYFDVGWGIDSNLPTGSTQGCALPASVKSYPPNSYTQLSLTLQPQPNGQTWAGKAYMCNFSTNGIDVSAVATSSSFIANSFLNASAFAPDNFVS